MRHIQSAALFGLIGGSALMFIGMTQSTMTLTFVGMALGLLVGVPAAYINFVMQGYTLHADQLRLVRETAQHQARRLAGQPEHETPRLTATADAGRPTLHNQTPAAPEVEVPEVEVIAVRQLDTSTEQPQPRPTASRPTTPPQPIRIPVEVVPEDAATTPATTPAPEPAKPSGPAPLSSAERQEIIDNITAEPDAAVLLPYTDHHDTLVRLYAVQRLGNLRDELALARLENALEDPEAIVRRAARLALNQFDTFDTDESGGVG